MQPPLCKIVISMDGERKAEIKGIALSFDIKKSSAFQDMIDRGLTIEEAQEIAKRYYPVNLAFPLFLAAAISHTQYDEARILLVRNLYEEHGSSKIEESHTRLFEHFIRAVGLNPEDYKNAPVGSEEESLINVYNKICFEGQQHTALAVLYAFEELFSPISESIAQGLRKSKVLDEKDFSFFPLHGVADIEHANKLREAVLLVSSTDEQWKESLEAAKVGAETLLNLFDSIATSAK